MKLHEKYIHNDDKINHYKNKMMIEICYLILQTLFQHNNYHLFYLNKVQKNESLLSI